MNTVLVEIEAILEQVERLAGQLRADPDRFIYRSAMELRATFVDRRPIEPALERVRISVRTLRSAAPSPIATRPRAATTLDFLDDVLEQELLPRLRRSGFEV
jgi:hypothetical protein